METHETEQPQARNTGLLSWFGFGRTDEDGQNNQPRSKADVVRRAKRLLIDRIGHFLLDNNLEITGSNLATAHEIFAGLNPGLERRILRRMEEGRPINQSWLDCQLAESGEDEETSLDEYALKLELCLAEFSHNTQSARTANRQYGDALEGHVDRLKKAPDANEIIGEIATCARAMLDRSRKVEADLRNSSQKAQELQRNLERARQDADLDFLTGLPNRRAFEKVLEDEIAKAQNDGESLAVAFCDIDHFKAVNDTHGHEAGDRIICVVAETLNKASGETCHVARHGGEEFVLLFRKTTTSEALKLLDDARCQMAERKLINRRTEQAFGQVTFSGGVADVLAYSSPREALAAADEALYQAKENGRNQIKLAAEAA